MEQEALEAGRHLGGITFGTFLLDALFVFLFVVRRRDISGFGKVLWVIKAAGSITEEEFKKLRAKPI